MSVWCEPLVTYVKRVSTEHGSHIEPPCDQSWSDLDKLHWHAAVVQCDSGVQVSIEPADYKTKRFGRWVREHGYYSVMVRGAGSSGPHSFMGAWSYLNGIEAGATATQRANVSRNTGFDSPTPPSDHGR